MSMIATEKVLHSWSITSMTTWKFSHVWTIENFMDILKWKENQYLLSEVFCAGDKSLDGRLKLHPNRNGSVEINFKFSENKEYVQLKGKEFFTKFTLSILLPDKVIITEFEDEMFVTVGADFESLVSRNRQVFYDQEAKLLKGPLTLICKGSIYQDSYNVSGETINTQFELPKCSLSANFSKVFQSQKFSDFILIVDGEEFHAHKFLLSSRSKVLEEIVDKNPEGKAEITGINKDTFSEILHFLYTDDVSSPDKLTPALLAAANEYGLKKLEIQCQESLASKLSVENSCESLICAEKYKAVVLKDQAVSFISKHLSQVMITPEWKLMKSNPITVAEIFQTAFKEK